MDEQNGATNNPETEEQSPTNGEFGGNNVPQNNPPATNSEGPVATPPVTGGLPEEPKAADTTGDDDGVEGDGDEGNDDDTTDNSQGTGVSFDDRQ